MAMNLSRYLVAGRDAKAASAAETPPCKRKGPSAAAVAEAVASAAAKLAGLDPDSRGVAAIALEVWRRLQLAAPEYAGVFRSDFAKSLADTLEIPVTSVYRRDRGTDTETGILCELLTFGLFSSVWAGRSPAVTLPELAPKPRAASLVSLDRDGIRAAAAAFLAKPATGKGKK